MNKTIAGSLALLLMGTTLLALAPTAEAHSYLCTSLGANDAGGERIYCTLYVYEGRNLVCLWGTRDSTPGAPSTEDTYACWAKV